MVMIATPNRLGRITSAEADDDQQRAFGEALLDGADGRLDQFRPVIDGVDDDAAGQRSVDLFEPLGDRDRHFARIFADQHVDRAEHDFLPVLGRGTVADFRADRHVGDIGDADWCVLAIGDDNAGQVLFARCLPRNPDQILRSRSLDIARADIGVVLLQRADHVLDCQAETREPFGIWRDFIFLAITADRIDLGYAGDVPQLRAHHPIVQRAQILRGIGRPVGLAAARLGFDRVHEDFAETRCDRSEFGVDRLGQRAAHALKPFVDQLTREIDVGAVFENDGYLA